ncbi:MAG TPA: hypothetical protein VN577_08810 [Terriglobales bacterium]|nr:hypothetical protein [Terriglobales bacterium]
MIRYSLVLLLLASSMAVAQDKSKVQAAGKTQDATEAVQTAKAQPPAEAQQTALQGSEQQKSGEDSKLVSVPGGKALGMSILGNQDAPKSLVIVPWKTSELGDTPGISPMLDDSRQPVDKEVFMRSLRYYEIRSESKP